MRDPLGASGPQDSTQLGRYKPSKKSLPKPDEIAPALREALQRAVASHRAGNLAEAERFYKTILSAKPDQFDALQYLGVLERQRSRYQESLRLITRAVEINPESAEAHSSLGDALHALNRPDEALASYETALRIKPDYAGALNSRGAALAKLNRLTEAIASYDKALAIRPDYVDALSNRGVAQEALDRLDEAIASYDMALAIKPGHAIALNNRGNALQRLTRYEDALESYNQALAIDPHYADAHNNLGNALRALDRPEEAIASYDQALAIRPDYAAALNHRGNALHVLKRDEEALASFERALAVEPGFADAWNNRGVALAALNRHQQALASYDKALAIKPAFADGLFNRGNALQALDRLEEAIASYDRALAIKPDHADALSARGNALQGLNRHGEALASCDKALAIKPAFADGLLNRGNALQALDRLEEAIASYDRALAIKPDHANALSARGSALQGLNRHAEALASYEKALAIQPDHPDAKGMPILEKLHCSEWKDREGDVECLVRDVRAGKRVGTPFVLLSVSDSVQDQLRCAQAYVREECPASLAPLWSEDKYAHDRIRLAYLSADFHDHATAFLMAELFELHDAKRFETTAVSFGPTTRSNMRLRLEGAFERFIDVREQSDREVAALLRELEIDIAVDLKGFTKGCRPKILAYRPAPIQVNYLGYAGSMGADYIDYILADRCVIPEAHHAYYSEKVVHLPDTYQVNDRTRRIAERTPSRAEAGLPEKGFVFCSFNNNYKITPMVFDTWMRLLREVDGAVLWLLEGNADAPGHLRSEAVIRGVAPDRLVFAARVELAGHLARHRLANLFLDTLPYNAHTTASDALWAGLPILTCLGTTFAGRVAGSLLSAIGLPELITHSLQEYEALALKLATDAAILTEIKQRLARNRETFPLFDTDRFRRHIEAAYVSMWERYQRGERPASFAVDPTDH